MVFLMIHLRRTGMVLLHLCWIFYPPRITAESEPYRPIRQWLIESKVTELEIKEASEENPKILDPSIDARKIINRLGDTEVTFTIESVTPETVADHFKLEKTGPQKATVSVIKPLVPTDDPSIVIAISTVWSIWFVTLQTCVTRPADMIESCAIAYQKNFLYAFMLYFIPILPYFTNSGWLPRYKFAKKIHFQKVWRDFDCWEERSPVANWDLTRVHERVFLATKKTIWGLSPRSLLSHHQAH